MKIENSWIIDAFFEIFPEQTPYHYAYNSPLVWKDPSGLYPAAMTYLGILQGLSHYISEQVEVSAKGYSKPNELPSFPRQGFDGSGGHGLVTYEEIQSTSFGENGAGYRAVGTGFLAEGSSAEQAAVSYWNEMGNASRTSVVGKLGKGVTGGKPISSNSPGSISRGPELSKEVRENMENRRSSTPSKPSIGDVAYEAQFYIPVWGSCVKFGEYFNKGEYVHAGLWAGIAAIETVSLGMATAYTANLKGASVVATKTGMKAIEAGSYTFTKTASKHLPSRPYMNSPSTISNIMKSGKGVPDATFKGGMNYKVPGTFNGSQGVWELGINPQTNTIYHFLFKSIK